MDNEIHLSCDDQHLMMHGSLSFAADPASFTSALDSMVRHEGEAETMAAGR